MTRRRYVYREVAPGQIEAFEVGDSFTGADRRAQTGTEEIIYGKIGAVATGEHIDSRRKMNEYMKRNGVAHASDYSPEHYAKKQAERAKAFTPGSGYDKARRQEAIHTAVQKLRGMGKLK